MTGGKSMNKKKLIVFAVIVLSGMLIASIIPTILLCAGVKLEVRSTDVDYLESKYLKTIGFYSNFLSFPRSLDNVKAINDYYYIDYQLNGGCIVVLDVTYDETSFENEIARLDIQLIKNEKKSGGYDYKKFKYYDDGVLFDYPVYIASYDYFNEYEYVCIDYENMRCVYVFMRYMSYDKIPLDKKYVPINYQNDYSNKDSSEYEYTIYS